jgi:glycosyl-4,4'-diaponeurosporenoate acyltransferase
VAGLGFYDALGIDVVIWPVWSAGVGWWAARRPDGSFAADGWLTRLRPWERDGLVYTRVGVRRWKGRLPDLGTVFGGRRKELPTHREPEAWRRLAAETRRAECVHWLILVALPVEALIHGGVVLAPMAAYALVANVPCIVAQRHNRGRLEALLRSRARRDRAADVDGPPPGRAREATWLAPRRAR